MSGADKIIDWNPQKKKHDFIMFGCMMLYLALFTGFNAWLQPDITFETLFIRATGTLAILMLHIILIIGPLSRIFPPAKTLLYHRRHLGVSMFFVAAIHGIFSIIQYHGGGNKNPLISLFTSNTDYFSFVDFPFMTLGFFALIILFLMAATSHDFWLKKLTAKTWKKLHISVYFAYAMIIFHVLLGTLQNDQTLSGHLLLLMGVVAVYGIHILANIKDSNIKQEAINTESHAKWGKKFVWIILASCVFFAGAITLSQKTFSKGVYEFGNQSELEGFLSLSPVPHLRIYNDKGIYGEQIYKSVILTGRNKFGADEVVKSIFDANNIPILADSFYVKLKGTLIYNDGKALLELTDGANALVDILPVPAMIANDSLSNDAIVGGFNPYKLETFLRGEIIDPKCYFGAMKPGSGKVHKSCAIRCISGGIPPVLKVSIGDANEYYILYGENGHAVNQEILDYVAEPVEIHGHFEALDDWQVLYIDPKTGIRKL